MLIQKNWYFPPIFFLKSKKTIKENVHSKLNQIFLSIAMRCVTESPSTTILNKEYVHQHTWTNNIKIQKSRSIIHQYTKKSSQIHPKLFFLHTIQSRFSHFSWRHRSRGTIIAAVYCIIVWFVSFVSSFFIFSNFTRFTSKARWI